MLLKTIRLTFLFSCVYGYLALCYVFAKPEYTYAGLVMYLLFAFLLISSSHTFQQAVQVSVSILVLFSIGMITKHHFEVGINLFGLFALFNFLIIIKGVLEDAN